MPNKLNENNILETDNKKSDNKNPSENEMDLLDKKISLHTMELLLRHRSKDSTNINKKMIELYRKQEEEELKARYHRSYDQSKWKSTNPLEKARIYRPFTLNLNPKFKQKTKVKTFEIPSHLKSKWNPVDSITKSITNPIKPSQSNEIYKKISQSKSDLILPKQIANIKNQDNSKFKDIDNARLDIYHKISMMMSQPATKKNKKSPENNSTTVKIKPLANNTQAKKVRTVNNDAISKIDDVLVTKGYEKKSKNVLEKNELSDNKKSSKLTKQDKKDNKETMKVVKTESQKKSKKSISKTPAIDQNHNKIIKNENNDESNVSISKITDLSGKSDSLIEPFSNISYESKNVQTADVKETDNNNDKKVSDIKTIKKSSKSKQKETIKKRDISKSKHDFSNDEAKDISFKIQTKSDANKDDGNEIVLKNESVTDPKSYVPDQLESKAKPEELKETKSSSKKKELANKTNEKTVKKSKIKKAPDVKDVTQIKETKSEPITNDEMLKSIEKENIISEENSAKPKKTSKKVDEVKVTKQSKSDDAKSNSNLISQTSLDNIESKPAKTTLKSAKQKEKSSHNNIKSVNTQNTRTQKHVDINANINVSDHVIDNKVLFNDAQNPNDLNNMSNQKASKDNVSENSNENKNISPSRKNIINEVNNHEFANEGKESFKEQKKSQQIIDNKIISSEKDNSFNRQEFLKNLNNKALNIDDKDPNAIKNNEVLYPSRKKLSWWQRFLKFFRFKKKKKEDKN